MNHKVLLADDSLTIQKVIKITLANQPYDITDCSNEAELFQKLPAVQPKIVFLDFNLSEKFTGYELTSKIKAICPETKVLLLLGTFDTVDDAALEKCGASDKIVKPFDSNKFIAICKQLIKQSEESEQSAVPADEDLEMPGDDEEEYDSEESQDEPAVEAEPEDQWQMSNPAARSVEEVKVKIEEPKIAGPTVNKLDALTLEISDWGMSVPNIINNEEPQEIRFDLPPIIEKTAAKAETPAPKAEALKVESPKLEKQDYKPFEIKFPETNDLDYPTIEELQQKAAPVADAAPILEAKTESKPKPQLVSIDSFNDKDLEFEIQGNYVEDAADVSSIEAQIRDEVEEDLWHADEFEELKREVSSKIEAMKTDFDPSGDTFDEAHFGRLDENDTKVDFQSEPKFAAAEEQPRTLSVAPAPAVDLEALKIEMEAMVKKHVQEYMDQMFKSNVEKITWEVIPDLAENLIRQELSKIANKIINDQN
ncbi:MAG TPA: response regulator [Bacteriovoracaceae bacterium]|nr:response regulator [Bacteriovoracaceae bacterium]